jgi:hypothetical protein
MQTPAIANKSLKYLEFYHTDLLESHAAIRQPHKTTAQVSARA